MRPASPETRPASPERGAPSPTASSPEPRATQAIEAVPAKEERQGPPTMPPEQASQRSLPGPTVPTNGAAPSQGNGVQAQPAPERRAVPAGPEGDEPGERGATGPQLRRFIKSRAYVPMHELRRRFAINGHDDEVTAVDVDKRRVFVGLPDREGRLLGELLRGGDIGYELSMDPITPIVVGVYPMRPVTRP
jgi:hypothetical protein